MSDLFHELVPFEFVDQVFAVMALAPRHTFQVLTKRPERMAAYMLERPTEALVTQMAFVMAPDSLRGERDAREWKPLEWPLGNVWLGTSVEDNRVRHRVNHLRRVPAAVRFLSCEPLIGSLDLDLDGIHWVIVGGESGRGHRPVEAQWVREIHTQAEAAGTAFFFKQWGGVTPKAGGRELDGQTYDEMPGAWDQHLARLDNRALPTAL
jgi:protein gp37